MVHLLKRPIHELLQLENLNGGSLRLLVLRRENGKVDAERALVTPIPLSGSLSTTDFDRSKWEIMYSLFVEEGLIEPSKCVSRKDA
jgi:hypothetical protein